MSGNLRKILTLVDSTQHWKLLLLLVLSILSGIAQVAGVGSIMPFVAGLTNPDILEQNSVLRLAHGWLGAPSSNAFVMILGAIVLAALVFSNALIAFTQWFTFRFVRWNQYQLSRRLLQAYLSRPYVHHLQHNSADTGKNILTETQTFTQQVLLAGLQAMAAAVSILFIALFLIWLNPLVAAVAIAVIGGAYGMVYFALRRRLRRVGGRRLKANAGRFKAANEAFGAIKELKAAGREAVFLDRFDPVAKRFAQALATQQLLRHLPRHLIEVAGIGSVLLIVLVLMAMGHEATAIAPLLGVYAFAGYRLFPAFQHVYHGASGLRANSPVVNALHADLSIATGVGTDPGGFASRKGLEKLPLRKAIEINAVSFTYPGADCPALDDVSLTIPCGTAVAFVGRTGAGKTTLADIIIGLLRPQRGSILVDGVKLTDMDLPRWRANLGYVPQYIYLSDDTIAQNIAFCLPDAEINSAAVERAARIANIHDFIVNELPHGYNTVVGERGIRLSGGQRQRIGIARALYHDPELLVLDEATSALDNATEETVQKAIEQAAQAKTLIIVAHRLSTVRNCDLVYVLDNGAIVSEGTYDSLLRASPKFQALAQVRA